MKTTISKKTSPRKIGGIPYCTVASTGATVIDPGPKMTGVRFHVVHGGVSQVNRFVFGSQSDVLDKEMSLADADVVIGGHAGVPFIARTRRGVWFNPGVIGMPANDGTTEVWYGLIEQSDDGAVRLATHRLSYDHRGAAAHLRKWGIADGYARALLTGLWPSLDVFPAAERALTGVRLEERELRLAPDFAAGT